MSEFKIDEFLLYVLRYLEIEVVSHRGRIIEIEKGYLIESKMNDYSDHVIMEK